MPKKKKSADQRKTVISVIYVHKSEHDNWYS